MTKRSFRIPVGERLRSKTPTRGKGSRTKTKVYDEKSKDYVIKKRGNK